MAAWKRALHGSITSLVVLLLVPWHPLVYRTPVAASDVARAPHLYLLWFALPLLLTQAAVFAAVAPRPAPDPS